jgi:hypothetical protein
MIKIKNLIEMSAEDKVHYMKEMKQYANPNEINKILPDFDPIRVLTWRQLISLNPKLKINKS